MYNPFKIKDFGFYVLLSVFIVYSFIFYFYLKDESVYLSIMHTEGLRGKINAEVDFYGRYKGEKVGGLPMLYSLVRKIKSKLNKEKVPNLLFDGGKTLFSGNSDVNRELENAGLILQIMSHLKYDGLLLNTREFNLGVKGITDVEKKAHFSFLGTNIEMNSNKVYPYVIKDYSDLRVGVLGIVNPSIREMGAKENFKEIIFKDPRKSLEWGLKELKKRHCDFIILISNLGNWKKENELIKMYSRNINLVLSSCGAEDKCSGHYYFENVPIIKFPQTTPTLGLINMVIEKYKLVDFNVSYFPIVESKITPDRKLLKQVKHLDPSFERRVLKRLIGYSLTDLSSEKYQESPFGNFVCDLLREKLKSEVVFVNSGNLRGLSIGKVSLEKIYNAIPFENKVVTLSLRGKDIRDILEHSFSRSSERGILQVSGISLEYNLEKKPFNRVSHIKIGGRPLDINKMYKVVTTDFLYQGGDGFYLFKEKGRRVRFKSNLKKYVIDYVKEVGDIYSKKDNRLKNNSLFKSPNSL